MMIFFHTDGHSKKETNVTGVLWTITETSKAA